jgi:hypothetical protein
MTVHNSHIIVAWAVLVALAYRTTMAPGWRTCTGRQLSPPQHRSTKGTTCASGQHDRPPCFLCSTVKLIGFTRLHLSQYAVWNETISAA